MANTSRTNGKTKHFSTKNADDPKLWMGFNLRTETGPVLRPTRIQYWKEPDFKKEKPDSPFFYRADAIVGLSLIQLNPNLQNPFTSPNMNYSFASEAWLHLEPHHELYQRAQPRVSSLRRKIDPKDAALLESFERQITEIIDTACLPTGFDLHHLRHFVERIEYFETKLNRPLLYNFDLQFSKNFTKKLHLLHSLLFHLRALVATDYNAHIYDVSHEALKIDSITDYIARADYVTNDAITYFQFKKLKQDIPTTAQKQLENAFIQYNHNGVQLIESLPASFINSMNQTQLEEALYLVQMDWLLGTESGLLFKIREELYGLSEGYEKVFWPDLEGHSQLQAHTLTVNCMLTEKDLYSSQEVA